MQQISYALIAALVATTLAAPATTPAPTSAPEPQDADLAGGYKCFHGDGSPHDGWPKSSAWGSFDALWNKQQHVLKNSCGWNHWGANNSPAEIKDIKSAIQSVAHSSGVDARFILATVMQESQGCVRVPPTHNGVTNPGLMQSHNGRGSCANKNPCPASEIHQMIEDGTAGTQSGDGLKQVLAKAKPHDSSHTASQQTYIAARLYNSGSANYNNLNDPVGATASYANDVANRLRGWVSTTPRGCTPH